MIQSRGVKVGSGLLRVYIRLHLSNGDPIVLWLCRSLVVVVDSRGWHCLLTARGRPESSLSVHFKVLTQCSCLRSSWLPLEAITSC